MREETVDSEEEEVEHGKEAGEEVPPTDAMQIKTTDSEEELEEEIERKRVAVDEFYRQRAKRAGVDIEGMEGRLLSEEELDNLSERLGDGEGARAKRRKEIEKMSIKEVEAEIKEVKRSLMRKEAKKTVGLPLMMTIICLLGGLVKGFITYDCSQYSQIVLSVGTGCVCQHGEEGGGGDHAIRGDHSDQTRKDDSHVRVCGHRNHSLTILRALLISWCHEVHSIQGTENTGSMGMQASKEEWKGRH
jgi:hypothetical protein